MSAHLIGQTLESRSAIDLLHLDRELLLPGVRVDQGEGITASLVHPVPLQIAEVDLVKRLDH